MPVDNADVHLSQCKSTIPVQFDLQLCFVPIFLHRAVNLQLISPLNVNELPVTYLLHALQHIWHQQKSLSISVLIPKTPSTFLSLSPSQLFFSMLVLVFLSSAFSCPRKGYITIIYLSTHAFEIFQIS
jgi:hypothetical protein